MEKIIKLHSRGEVNNYLKKMLKPDGSECKTYALKTDIPYLRVGTVEGGKKFIDPSGGPMIGIGYQIQVGEQTLELVEIKDFKLKFKNAEDKEII
jgi:hypothetical protein